MTFNWCIKVLIFVGEGREDTITHLCNEAKPSYVISCENTKSYFIR